MTAFTKEDEVRMIRNSDLWPGETLCLKKRPKEGEKVGIMGYSSFGVMTSSSAPFVIHLRPDFAISKIYDTVEELLADGWIVD